MSSSIPKRPDGSVPSRINTQRTSRYTLRAKPKETKDILIINKTINTEFDINDIFTQYSQFILSTLFYENCTFTTVVISSNHNFLTLSIENCSTQRELTLNLSNLIHLSLKSLNSLIILKIHNCNKLTNLKLNLTRLKVLEIDNCSELTELKLISKREKQLYMLRKLTIYNCNKLINLELNLEYLEVLDIDSCDELTELTKLNLEYLRELAISNCRKLTNLELNLTRLKVLDIDSCDELTELNLTGLTMLENLYIDYCNKLKYLDLTSLVKLQELYFSNSRICVLNLSNTTNIEITSIYLNTQTYANLKYKECDTRDKCIMLIETIDKHRELLNKRLIGKFINSRLPVDVFKHMKEYLTDEDKKQIAGTQFKKPKGGKKKITNRLKIKKKHKKTQCKRKHKR